MERSKRRKESPTTEEVAEVTERMVRATDGMIETTERMVRATEGTIETTERIADDGITSQNDGWNLRNDLTPVFNM